MKTWLRIHKIIFKKNVETKIQNIARKTGLKK